jgi:hypothetical protein
MNEHDRNNIEFIMSLDDEQTAQWVSNLTADDHAYALEIIELRLNELYEQLVEAELAQLDSYPTVEQIIRNIGQ